MTGRHLGVGGSSLTGGECQEVIDSGDHGGSQELVCQCLRMSEDQFLGWPWGLEHPSRKVRNWGIIGI